MSEVNREPIPVLFGTTFKVWLSPGFMTAQNGASMPTSHASDTTLDAMVQRWIENTYAKADRPVPARFALPTDHQSPGASRAEGEQASKNTTPQGEES